jgi:DNA-binding CsgD family transcriptional regulator
MILGLIKDKIGDHSGAMIDLDKSIKILKRDFTIHPGPSNIQYSEILAHLGKITYENGEWAKSLRYNREGFSMAQSMRQLRQVMITARYISLLHEKDRRFDSALFYHKIFSDMADSLSQSGNVRAVKLLEIRQEYQKKQKESELNMALEMSGRRTWLIIYLSSGVVLLAVIIILFLMLKIEKQKKRQAEVEKLGLNEKLEYQNKELTTNVLFMTRMNELVVALAEKLKKLSLTDNSENSGIVKSIINELERTSNPDNWKEFEVRFQKVHTDFYRKLSEQFPDLTPNELKLCAFLRLNMSTKEISSITFQSQNSIMVARSRLRQKLGITKDENLVTFLAQI